MLSGPQKFSQQTDSSKGPRLCAVGTLQRRCVRQAVAKQPPAELAAEITGQISAQSCHRADFSVRRKSRGDLPFLQFECTC